MMKDFFVAVGLVFLIFVLYYMYMISYNGLNPFQ